MTLGQNIQTARKAKGMSQEALAERIGISRQALGKWEKDTALPGLDNLQALAAELGLGDSVIFAGVRSNIQSFYDAMDAFLLPSLFEGLPVVLVEAQTAGLPCFVSDTVDPGAAFTDRVRFLPLQDTGAWADAIAAASFRRDPQAREKAVRAGYDIHTSAAVLQEFYLRRYAEVTK